MLSLHLPLALVPLLKFTDSPLKMGNQRNSPLFSATSWFLAFVRTSPLPPPFPPAVPCPPLPRLPSPKQNRSHAPTPAKVVVGANACVVWDAAVGPLLRQPTFPVLSVRPARTPSASPAARAAQREAR